METDFSRGEGGRPPENDQIDKYVGARLRLRRKLLGFSQTKLADAVGLTFQQIQKYERGKSRIAASRLWTLAHAMRVPVSYFFDGLDEPAPIIDEPLGASELRLCHAMRRLPQQQRRRLHDMVMAFAEPSGPDGLCNTKYGLSAFR